MVMGDMACTQNPVDKHMWLFNKIACVSMYNWMRSWQREPDMLVFSWEKEEVGGFFYASPPPCLSEVTLKCTDNFIVWCCKVNCIPIL